MANAVLEIINAGEELARVVREDSRPKGLQLCHEFRISVLVTVWDLGVLGHHENSKRFATCYRLVVLNFRHRHARARLDMSVSLADDSDIQVARIYLLADVLRGSRLVWDEVLHTYVRHAELFHHFAQGGSLVLHISTRRAHEDCLGDPTRRRHVELTREDGA